MYLLGVFRSEFHVIDYQRGPQHTVHDVLANIIQLEPCVIPTLDGVYRYIAERKLYNSQCVIIKLGEAQTIEYKPNLVPFVVSDDEETEVEEGDE